MQFYTPQPAHKMYVFDRGWRVLRTSTKKFFHCARETDLWYQDKADEWNTTSSSSDDNSFQQWSARALNIGCIIAGKLQYVSATVFIGLFCFFWLLWMILAVAGSFVLMSILIVYTRLFMFCFRIFNRCQSCHKRMDLPIFRCNRCAVEHTRLIPSIYGLFRHRCTGSAFTGPSGCTAHLPTMDGLGREKLTQYCVHCKSPLNPGIGRGTNVHIALVGGIGSGKTHYMVMALKIFKETFETIHHYCITFPDKRDRDAFEGNVKRLSQGHILVKTPDLPTPAYNLEIRSPRAVVPKLAYIYDVPGESFNNEEKLQQHRYYIFNDGILFVIDPATIPGYRQKHEQKLLRLHGILVSDSLNPMIVCDRMLSMLNNVARSRLSSIPVAVVISKVDALSLEDEIGAKAVSTLVSKGWNTGDAIHMRVREFLLEYDLGNMVRELENNFSQVRYFSCSALGRLPDLRDTSSFSPVRVLDPLEWLFTKTSTIAPRQKYPTTQKLVQKMRN
jgi:Double-GTPase 2